MKIITKNKTIDFHFYLDVFKEVFNTDYVKVLLSLFKAEKIIIRQKIDPKTHSAVLKLIYKNSKKVLDLIKGDKKKILLKDFIYLLSIIIIILYLLNFKK